MSKRRPIDVPVHRVGWAAQGHVQLACSDSWAEAKWGSDDETSTTDEDVHVAEDDRLYTFDEDKVTCEACAAMPTGSGGAT